MATPSYSARFSSATSRASPASSFVSTKMVAWNPSERRFSWTAAAISGCLPNPRMRRPVGREGEAIDILELGHRTSFSHDDPKNSGRATTRSGDSSSDAVQLISHPIPVRAAQRSRSAVCAAPAQQIGCAAGSGCRLALDGLPAGLSCPVLSSIPNEIIDRVFDVVISLSVIGVTFYNFPLDEFNRSGRIRVGRQIVRKTQGLSLFRFS